MSLQLRNTRRINDFFDTLMDPQPNIVINHLGWIRSPCRRFNFQRLLQNKTRRAINSSVFVVFQLRIDATFFASHFLPQHISIIVPLVSRPIAASVSRNPTGADQAWWCPAKAAGAIVRAANADGKDVAAAAAALPARRASHVAGQRKSVGCACWAFWSIRMRSSRPRCKIGSRR